MIFLLLASAVALLAVIRVQTMRTGDPGVVRAALVRGGFAYVAFWILGTGVFGPGGPLALPMLSASLLRDFTWIASAILAILLWTSLVDVAFYRFRRRDLVLVAPFGAASILLGANPSVLPLAAAIAASPALIRMRWRREVSPGVLTATALVGFLFILLYFVSVQVGVAVPQRPFASEVQRFSAWVLSLALVYLLISLPRLAWGMSIQIQSVSVRLVVSHMLTGLVPVVLIGLFWGLSTYLSVNSDRAQLAARHLQIEATRIGHQLEAGLTHEGTATEDLVSWVRVVERTRPGVRLWLGVYGPPGLGSRPVEWTRAFGAPLEGENSLGTWPGDRMQEGIVIVQGEPFLAAIRRGGAPANARGMEAVRAALGSTPLAGGGSPDARNRLGTPLRPPGMADASDSSSAAGRLGSLDTSPSALTASDVPGGLESNPFDGPEAAILLIPLDSVLQQETSQWLDAQAFLDTRYKFVSPTGSMITIQSDTLSAESSSPPGSSVGAAIVPALELQDGTWIDREPLLRAQVGFAAALRGLTRNLQENPANLIPLIFLLGVAFLFVLVEVLTLGMVMSMARSITQALGAMNQGTARLREGNLRYRIPIEGRDELWDLAESFNRMAVNLEQARDLEIEKERLEGELALARQIQARLLPGEAPIVAGVELAGMSLPAREVGGDYYDFLRLPDGRLGLIIADVSGKGVPAALLMSSFRASLLSQPFSDGPAEVMGRLNVFLHRSVEPGRFVTAFFGVLDPSSGEFVYCNAGHNPPYLLSSEGVVRVLKEGGLVLGLFRETIYEQAQVVLTPSETLALFTDGVTEAQNAEDELWGEDRLLHILHTQREAPCRRIMTEILAELRTFAGGEPQSDDITLLLARYRGPVALVSHDPASESAVFARG